MSNLFSPIRIKNLSLRNRIVMSPMCQYSSSDGFAGDWHLVHIGSRAAGGTGLVIMEATAVSPEGRISPADLGLWKDEHIEGLARIAVFAQSQGAAPGIQLAHAGRKASCAVPWEGGKQLDVNNGGWQTVGPSAASYHEGERPPLALDKVGIGKIIADFRAAAKRAKSAGLKVIEIHAAHGYLIHEFLSPLSNFRNDEYGGPFANRIRLLREVAEAIRTQWPEENPLFVRISATDWKEGGWTLDESIELARILKNSGVDLIDCSSGGNVHGAKIPVSMGYQVPFSEALRQTGILTGAVGFITTAKQADSIVQGEKADLVFFARELLRNPYFPLSAAKELAHEITWPLQYLRAK